MKKITGLIICGFPGVGKTTAAKKLPRDVIDVESGGFRWKRDRDEDGFPVRTENKNWASVYVDHIQLLASQGEYRYVLASLHKEVREELDKRCIPYIVVVPNNELRDEYLIRYIKRGNTHNFIKTVYYNWHSWLYEIEDSEEPIIHLSAGQTISDIFPV